MKDKLSRASEKPDVLELHSEYRKAIDDGFTSERLDYCDKQRLAVWDGQSKDFKKHSDDESSAFPWEGAADTRQRLVDTTIRTLTDLLMVSFRRAQVRINPVEAGDSESAAALNTLFRWLVGSKLYNELQKEAELYGEYALTYGYSAMFVGWEQSSILKPQEITMEALSAMSEQGGAEMGFTSEIVEMIQDPEFDNQVAELFVGLVPNVKKRRALKMVKELRETGATEVPIAEMNKNQPVCVALKPFEDIVFPDETVDLQKARVIFRKTYMTEVELRAKIQEDDWDEKFVDAAVETSGKSQDATNVMINATTLAPSFDTNRNMIEIVHAYTRQLNDDDVPGIYCTVFSPYATQSDSEEPLYGKHELVGYAHGNYPFVEYRRERPSRRAITESRGVAEVSACAQSELKAQRDSIIDRTSLETIPPIQYNRRLGMVNNLGPAVMVPVSKPGDYQPLQLTAGVPATSMQCIEMIMQDTADYYGLPHSNIPPVTTTLKQQALVNNWLCSWTEIYQQMLALSLQYLSPQEVERVTGVPLEVKDLSTMPDFILKFDARDMNDDYVLKKLEVIAQQLLPLDAGGSIERNALVEKLVRSIAPELADEILVDQGSASQRIYNETKGELVGMMAGYEANYQEKDPAAQSKMQYLEQLVKSNPKALEAAQGDEQFKTLLDNYSQSLQFSMQQQQNAQIGRIGVKPIQQGQGQPPAQQ